MMERWQISSFTNSSIGKSYCRVNFLAVNFLA